MKVFIGYASAHGSTAEVAREIGNVLEERGIQVTTANISEVNHVNTYDAYILGSAIHAGAFLPEMKQFLKSGVEAIGSHPLYCFVTCIRVLEQYGLEHVLEFYMMPELLQNYDVRDRMAFAGKLDLDNTDWNERWTLAARYDGSSWPSNFDGDFRDWGKVRQWASKIADELKGAPSA
jgi:menaquinone-dependent protoporphyrinogen oxidase